MAFIEVDDGDFGIELDKAFERDETVIVKFGSDYCDPCHALECELEELDGEMENLTVLMVDTDESEGLVEEFDIFQLPTMIIYRDKKIIYNGEGVMLSSDIKSIIEAD